MFEWMGGKKDEKAFGAAFNHVRCFSSFWILQTCVLRGFTVFAVMSAFLNRTYTRFGVLRPNLYPLGIFFSTMQMLPFKNYSIQ